MTQIYLVQQTLERNLPAVRIRKDEDIVAI